MDELFVILMSWAVTLSGHPAPANMPEVTRVPHSYLTQAACGGRECKVMGWFPPGSTIYVDERLDPQNNLLASSVIVHEMVHYLQHEAHDPAKPFDCESTIALEREAYQVQRDFLMRYGVYQPVGASMHQVGCELAAHE
jgi:hypothetical protein